MVEEKAIRNTFILKTSPKPSLPTQKPIRARRLRDAIRGKEKD